MTEPLDAGRYPAHADLTDPAEAAWWERWALVGDAKEALARATQAWASALDEYRACRAASPERPVGPNCGCGHHLALVGDAANARDAAREWIAAAERDFKAG